MDRSILNLLKPKIHNHDDYHLLGDDTVWLPEDDNHHSHRRGNLKSYIHNHVHRTWPFDHITSQFDPVDAFIIYT
jgi:hypothetical protein